MGHQVTKYRFTKHNYIFYQNIESRVNLTTNNYKLVIIFQQVTSFNLNQTHIKQSGSDKIAFIYVNLYAKFYPHSILVARS